MWEDDESGYEGMDEPFPFCLVGEEFRCVLGVRYKEDKTESVWRGSSTYSSCQKLQSGVERQRAPLRRMGELGPKRNPRVQLPCRPAFPPPRQRASH